MWGQLFPRLVRTWEGHDRLVWWLLSLPQQEAFQRPLPQDTSPTANGSPWNLGYPPTWHLPCREMSDLPSLPIPHEAYQTGPWAGLVYFPLCPGLPALSRWVRAYTKSPGTLLSYVLRGHDQGSPRAKMSLRPGLQVGSSHPTWSDSYL